MFPGIVVLFESDIILVVVTLTFSISFLIYCQKVALSSASIFVFILTLSDPSESRK